MIERSAESPLYDMIDRDALSRRRAESLLINVARGTIWDEAAVVRALGAWVLKEETRGYKAC